MFAVFLEEWECIKVSKWVMNDEKAEGIKKFIIIGDIKDLLSVSVFSFIDIEDEVKSIDIKIIDIFRHIAGVFGGDE